MFLELLRKEFIQRRSKESQSKIALILSLFLRILLYGGVVALICFISTNLDTKIEKYSSYGYYDFLSLFLSVSMVVGILLSMVKARGVLFDREDSLVSMPLPISPSTIVLSKVAYLYVESSLSGLILYTPFLVCYGSTRGFIPYYYIFSFLYPFFISLFIIGIGLLLSLAYQQVYKLVRKNDIVQFVTASVLMVLLCYLYQFVLNLFLGALNDSSVGGMFSSSFVETLHNMVSYFAPVSLILDMMVKKTNVQSDILLSLGMVLLSLVLGIGSASLVFYHEIKNGEDTRHTKTKKFKGKMVSPAKILLKKEMDLLFKDETNLFSYTSLLILCPFLTYLVISSLNSIIYDNLKFYASYFPELISGINLTLILLFSGVINASASLSVSREGKAVWIIKTLPISPLRQILCKIAIPLMLSLFSLLVTDIVLVSFGIISVSVFFSSLFIGSVMTLFNNVFGIYADMKDRDPNPRRIKLSFINNIVPLLFPLFIFLLFFLLSVYLRLPGFALYLLGCFISLLLLVPFLFHFRKRLTDAFLKMEVHN